MRRRGQGQRGRRDPGGRGAMRGRLGFSGGCEETGGCNNGISCVSLPARQKVTSVTLLCKSHTLLTVQVQETLTIRHINSPM